jgi:protein TonB
MTTALSLERDDLRIWVISAAAVVAVHAGAVLTLLQWHEPVSGEDTGEVVLLDLPPITGPTAETKQDLAPGPEQLQAAPVPKEQPKEPEQKPEEKVEPPPPVPNAEAVLPKEVPKPVEQPKPVMPPAPVATAPARPHPSAAGRDSWNRLIALQLQRHKGYPAAAIARNETGTSVVAFTLDRRGVVVASRVTQSSGYPALDQEALATVKRAAPFPMPPESVPGESFDFTVPFPFRLH